MLNSITDLYLTYTFLRKLTSSYDTWKAYKLGVIDKNGKILIKKEDRDAWQKESLSNFDTMILNLRKILAKMPGGSSTFARYSAALFLLKESENNITDLEKRISDCVNEMEGIPTNNVGTGNIAGVNGDVYSPIIRKKLKRKKLEEKVSDMDMKILKDRSNSLFNKIGIKTIFTHHFKDRINDERNKPEITLKELLSFYNNQYLKNGKKIATMNDIEAVLKELSSDINIPVYIEKNDRGEVELRAKTIMRKPDFISKGRVITA
jgi:uncharacterized protein YxeA